MLAPIILFVYNRPLHTRQTLEALSKNHLADQSALIVYADGAKEDATPHECDKIREVHTIVKERQWCKTVQIVESDSNRGLAKSVIFGITSTLKQYERVIVLEDDLITSPWFLTFMNQGLDLYQNISSVYSVNGYMFPITTARKDIVLLPYTSTWGWATWRDKWSCFAIEPQLNEIVGRNKFLRQRFDLAHYDYTTMLLTAKHSWGIHWYFSVFKKNGLGVFPTKSLVENIGFDGSGINCGNEEVIQFKSDEKIVVESDISIDLDFFSDYLDFFTKSIVESKPTSFWDTTKHYIKRVLVILRILTA